MVESFVHENAYFETKICSESVLYKCKLPTNYPTFLCNTLPKNEDNLLVVSMRNTCTQVAWLSHLSMKMPILTPKFVLRACGINANYQWKENGTVPLRRTAISSSREATIAKIHFRSRSELRGLFKQTRRLCLSHHISSLVLRLMSPFSQTVVTNELLTLRAHITRDTDCNRWGSRWHGLFANLQVYVQFQEKK